MEEPAFVIVQHKGPFEVRNYPALIAAEVEVAGDGKQAGAAGFRLLAGYIFGANSRRQSIAMTTPVVQAPAATLSTRATSAGVQPVKDAGWTLQFMMPRRYALADLPVPNDEMVHLIKVPRSRIASVRFSGLARPPEVERKTAELNAFIAARRLSVSGPPSLARYDPPWTLWFLRRNEVWIPLRAEPAERSMSS